MALTEEIGELSLVMCILVCALSKLGPLPKEQLLLLTHVVGTCAFLAAHAIEEQAKKEEIMSCRVMITTGVVFTQYYNNHNRKRSMMAASDWEPREGKMRRLCFHNHARAGMSVEQDWLGINCTFSSRQFEQTFRLTRSIVERLIQACGNFEPTFFTEKQSAIGKPAIPIEVKVLGILKCIAFGCSGTAFRDYHQMATNTFTEGLKAFFRALKADKALNGEYMRYPSRRDVKRVTGLHDDVHGVPGMLGSLDCLHVYWKNCPVAWQGQFKNGRYKYSSVVVEAMVDHNLWFWHASIGHAGTNSDTNIWDVSPLQNALLSEHWAKHCDFEFMIDGQAFDKVWILVDGIYPPIARFVKTLSFLIGPIKKLFTQWQESARKDVERAFGVLTRKFQILARPLEYWHLEDIKRIIFGCILMHNMMVEVRIDRQEEETAGMYQLYEKPREERVECRRVEFLTGHAEEARGYNPHLDHVASHVDSMMQRWHGLYSDLSHVRLQSAVMNHIADAYINYKSTKMQVTAGA
jgi:Plant transposon protein